jgi:ectoine hydroxylase-related dioxygenase (phytanoyl-CoA dioxygenase family)
MANGLDPARLAAYREAGVVFPIPVLSAPEVADLRAKFDRLVAREGGTLTRVVNTRPHLILPWLDDLIRDPRVLDPVEGVLGPDILCWASGFFAKRPGDPAFVSWHQDATYWGLSSDEVVTAWIAFSPSTPRSGCMRVVPGSHRTRLEHADTFDADNLLSRGQEVAARVDEAAAVDVVLAPGEMSLHHVLIVHGSEPNRADDWRIGFTARYIPTRLRQLAPVKDTAMLVRGVDRFGHFEPEPRPKADFDPDAVAFHRAVRERLEAITGQGAARPMRTT